MGGEGEHPSAEGGDRPIVIEGTEIAQECLGAEKGRCLGGIEPADVLHGGESCRLQGEQDLTQVDAVDLRSLAGDTPHVLTFCPEAEADTWGCAPGAPGPLIGGGPTDFLDQEGVDPAAGIETRDAGQTAVDDAGYAIDRE